MAQRTDPGTTTAASPTPAMPARFSRRALGWSAVGAVVTLGALAGMVRVDHLAKGTARLQNGEWLDVVSPEAGRVVSVDVGLSQPVATGDVLAKVETASGSKAVTAPGAGRVGRVSVAKGAQVQQGQPLLAVLAPAEVPTLYALFPGEFRQELAPGMKLEFQLANMPEPEEAIIDRVESPEVSLQYARNQGGAEAARSQDAVLVLAQAVSRNYIRDGRQRVYQDGMTGRARVKLGTQRLLVSWFPGLRGALP
jgi:biotin carboxyl carrier protein